VRVKPESESSGSRPPTLATLAATLGVSSATVSNAFNRPDQLSAALRDRILRAARNAGYAGPDPTARALSRGKRGAIGLVFTERLAYAFADPAAVLFLEGLARACEDAATGLLLIPVQAGASDDGHSVQRAAVDALALYSLPDGDAAVDAALARHIPTVIIDQPQVAGTAFIGIDDRAAGKAALAHLLELGHRRLAVVGYRLTPERRSGPISRTRQLTASYRTTRSRLRGYGDALEGFGLGWETLTFYESDSNDPAGGAAAATRILSTRPRPTAIITDSDQLALGVLQAAEALGLDVPGELSVLGSDDIPAASMVSPGLTTIASPLIAKGEEAGRILLGQTTEKPTRILPFELIMRASTGTPPSQQTPRGSGVAIHAGS
jgi:DNA-binding LacI/PurR family transcriptional regulator